MRKILIEKTFTIKIIIERVNPIKRGLRPIIFKDFKFTDNPNATKAMFNNTNVRKLLIWSTEFQVSTLCVLKKT